MKNKLKFNVIFKGKNIFIIFIVIICIILIGLMLYYTQNIESFVDVAGAQSHMDGTSWNNDSEKKMGTVLNQCELHGECKTADGSGFGIYNANCECISIGKKVDISKKVNKSSAKTVKTYFPSSAVTTMPGLLEKDKNCMPNSTDFDAFCKKQNLTYNLKNLEKCDEFESKPICGPSEIDEEEISVRTPCLNKSDDFNTWCRFYSNKKNPVGYNVNSIGAKHVLIGSAGGCFVNGKPDNSKARGICTYNYTDEVIKLQPSNPNINYNVFTQCKDMRKTDFVKECSKLLKLDYKDTYADQITSYDCNPGFARAKCLNNKDKIPYNEIQFPINTTTNNKKDKCKCVFQS